MENDGPGFMNGATVHGNYYESLKILKYGLKRRLRKKIRRQGAQILRNEAYLSYVAVTKDAAQRRIRIFLRSRQL
jgi:hypothetical protein